VGYPALVELLQRIAFVERSCRLSMVLKLPDGFLVLTA